MPRRRLSTRTGLRTVLSRDAGHQCHTWRPPTYRLERSPLHACRQRWRVEKHSGTFVQGRRGPRDGEANSLRLRAGAGVGWGSVSVTSYTNLRCRFVRRTHIKAPTAREPEDRVEGECCPSAGISTAGSRNFRRPHFKPPLTLLANTYPAPQVTF